MKTTNPVYVDLIDIHEAAKLLGRTTQALRQARFRKSPYIPACIQVGNTVIYSRKAVEAFVASGLGEKK